MVIDWNKSSMFARHGNKKDMSKVILNSGKKLQILSNGGRYKLVAKMKVDFDSQSGTFGARDWVFHVYDLNKKENVNLQSKGKDVFKCYKHQYKRQLIASIKNVGCFSDAITEITVK